MTVNHRNIIIALLFAVLIFSPHIASAALEITYPEIPGTEAPQVFMEKIRTGVYDSSQALPLYVLYLYTLTIVTSGIVAFSAVLYGVVRYLISGGSVSQMIAAKEQISNAIIGLLIILSSYVIMTTIDPKMLVSISKSPIAMGPAVTYPGGYAVLMDYVEVPLGRLTESVIRKGWAAENAAAQVLVAAEYLSTLTERLKTITNPLNGVPGCRCSDQDSNCSGAGCSGSCRTEPCLAVRTELDSLIMNRYVPPTISPGSTVPTSCNACSNPIYVTIDNLSYNASNQQINYSIQANNNSFCSDSWQGVQCHLYVNGKFWGGCIVPGGTRLDSGNSGGLVEPVLGGATGTFAISASIQLDAHTGCGFTGVTTAACSVTIQAGVITSTTCGTGTAGGWILGQIPQAIEGLKAARCRASEAQMALAKELLRLKLAEVLLRDSQSSPITHETFLAFEGESADVKKLSIWDSVQLDKDPYDDPEDLYIGESEGNDPATFYVPVDGNEYIIELSKNAFFQFQPTAGSCGGIVGSGGQPPAACAAAVINPFPAFYQYGPSGVANPWQDSLIDSCSPSNKIMNYGCGPTSLAMIVKHLTAQAVNPKIIADQLKSDGVEYACGFGSTVIGLKRIAKGYNLNFVEINANQISSHLAKSHPVMTVCSTFFGRPIGHVTVIKGDNCNQFGFQDTVWGERWDNKQTAQNDYGCNYFLAFCNASEGADCGVPVIPPGSVPTGNFIAVNGTSCSENRSANKDLNPILAWQQYMELNNSAAKDYIDRVPLYGWAGFDAGAPFLEGLVGRRPSIHEVFKLKNPSSLEATWPVHAMNIWNGTVGETVKVPNATGYHISGGFEVLVAYADSHNITLNYLEEDQVAIGYAVQISDINVRPEIVKAYQDNEKCVSVGGGIKRYLLALNVGDPVGTTAQRAFFVIVRDSGAFMDPRLIQDWWEP